MTTNSIGLFLLRCALVAAKFIVMMLLLCVSALVPIAGWHRIAFGIRGWWIWPVVATLTIAMFHLAIALQAQLKIWYLLAIVPYAALMVIDSWLVLPRCVEHTREQVDRYLSKEVAA